jgi:hypothetical protein
MMHQRNTMTIKNVFGIQKIRKLEIIENEDNYVRRMTREQKVELFNKVHNSNEAGPFGHRKTGAKLEEEMMR